MQETDKRQRYILAENKLKTTGKLNMTVKKNQLLVNNQVYRKPAPAPTNADALKLDEQEQQMIQTATVVATREVIEKGNSFTVYAAEIENIQQVRAIHRHLKIKHLDATHVAVAHVLEGEMPNLRECDDDGEIGAGARMLNTIKQNGRTQVAVYMVRYHSGQNLGMKRFEIINDLTQNALELLNNPEHVFQSKLPKPKRRISTPRSSNRSRAGGRGASHSNRGMYVHSNVTRQINQAVDNTEKFQFAPPNPPTFAASFAAVTQRHLNGH